MNFKNRKADIRLIYKNVDNLELPLHLYLPEGDISKARTVILIHGGGWNDAIRDNSEWNGGWMADNAKYLCEQGFIAIVISYRSLKVSDNMAVPDILQDCYDAIMFIRKCLRFVNFDDIIYMGDSAGGYIATMLGLSQNDMLRPKLVVACNPVLACEKPGYTYGFKGYDNLIPYLPIKNISEKCANFLFLHGTADEVVDINDTIKMHNELQNRGKSSRLIEINDATHAFILFNYKYSDNYVVNVMEKIIKLL